MINTAALQHILSQYKENFANIHLEEIYKWKSVAQFQRHWKPKIIDFKKMLLEALDFTSELMNSSANFTLAAFGESASL